MLKGKTVVVGVCGGIAAYKAAELVSMIKKLHADVHVIMTHSACSFIAPLTFQTLSQNMVTTDMFERPVTWEIQHISLAKKADMFVVVPATANILGKAANGIADDMLSSTLMATKAPVMFAPAMNTNMYENPVVQKNINRLKQLGYIFSDCDDGYLACGDCGKGRLAPVDDILDGVLQVLAHPKDMSDISVLVSAGPTQEAIDPVRFITNHSSGKMGYALATVARRRGAATTLVSGPCQVKPPAGVDMVNVVSAAEMFEQFMRLSPHYDIIIKAAAVSDYRPTNLASQKIKKDSVSRSLDLTPNTDILACLGQQIKSTQVLAGFSMETENLKQYAVQKLQKKNLDFIVANSIASSEGGFKSDNNSAVIISRHGLEKHVPLTSKYNLSNIILDTALETLTQKKQAVL